jgi:hypothetical protein
MNTDQRRLKTMNLSLSVFICVYLWLIAFFSTPLGKRFHHPIDVLRADIKVRRKPYPTLPWRCDNPFLL